MMYQYLWVGAEQRLLKKPLSKGWSAVMDFSMIFELFVNLFQGIVFVTFCYKFLTPSKSKRVNLLAYLIAFILMFFSITLINWLYLSFAYIETVVFLAIMIPYCILFFKDKIYIKLIIPVFLNVFYSVLSLSLIHIWRCRR